jgi:hypothetical protein
MEADLRDVATLEKIRGGLVEIVTTNPGMLTARGLVEIYMLKNRTSKRDDVESTLRAMFNRKDVDLDENMYLSMRKAAA